VLTDQDISDTIDEVMAESQDGPFLGSYHERMIRKCAHAVYDKACDDCAKRISTRKVEADQTLPPVDADIQALRERVSVCIADVACNGESVVTLTHHIDNLVTASAERIKELEKEIEELKADMNEADEELSHWGAEPSAPVRIKVEGL
tara:strand:- start:2863 stop:3306 length:444 start_codon:yes stop_codon:yes gene_type:complete